MPNGKQLLSILKKTFPLKQATTELNWIKQELPESQWMTAVQQRAELKPLQYILGTQPFLNFEIDCKPGVLIPRNDTEEWCSELIDIINLSRQDDKRDIKIMDYCTGTGCIVIGLTMLKNCHSVVGVDFNNKAVELAQRNYEKNEHLIDHTNMNVSFHHGDLKLLDVPSESKSFDLLISNPPYIPEEDMCQAGGVEKSVLDYEPLEALVGDLEFYGQLVKLIPVVQAKAFVFELGYLRQAEITKSLLSNSWQCGIRYDSGGRIRNVIGWSDKAYAALQNMCGKML
ncbi:unnamed protein product [Ambrosiozyma monospora]|uniref:Unnamed protein product n=1 Tax=Ambrosiozyma monospora TaxID=43982 RepID=A0A9W6YSM2_AMBMO|nr:unnamed protein product [Ambrosiozyma monospora]